MHYSKEFYLRRPPYHDLDSLAGTWSEEDAAEFASATSDFEQVDQQLWR